MSPNILIFNQKNRDILILIVLTFIQAKYNFFPLKYCLCSIFTKFPWLFPFYFIFSALKNLFFKLLNEQPVKYRLFKFPYYCWAAVSQTALYYRKTLRIQALYSKIINISLCIEELFKKMVYWIIYREFIVNPLQYLNIKPSLSFKNLVIQKHL